MSSSNFSAARRRYGRWSRAQQPGGVRRLGVLMSVQDDAEGKGQLSGFTQALAGLGWIEGRNLRTEVRWGGGDVSRARMHAKELVALKPDVILAQGTLSPQRLSERRSRSRLFLWLLPILLETVLLRGCLTRAGISPAFLTSESANNCQNA